MLRLCLAILFAILVASCKKDNASISRSYPSAHYKTGLERTGEFKVYTSGGEVRDRSIINRFKAMDTGNFSYIFDDIKYRRAVMDTITFSDQRNATLRHNYFEVKCLVASAAQSLVLTSRDTTTGSISIDPLTDNISYHIRLIKPEVFSEYIYYSFQGLYAFGYTIREKFVLQKSGDRLIAPLIQFRLHSNRINTNGYVNNLLQQNFYTHIHTGDTVTLQQASILYQKNLK